MITGNPIQHSLWGHFCQLYHHQLLRHKFEAIFYLTNNLGVCARFLSGPRSAPRHK